MVELGRLSLSLALVVATYGIVAHVAALRQRNGRLLTSARGAASALAFLTTVASLALLYLLPAGDFSVKYVAGYTSRALPPVYKISAFWAGQAGSLLLWLWVSSLYLLAVTKLSRDDTRDMIPYVSTILLIIALFFTVVLVFVTNPFERLPVTPADGHGLNPLLQNPGMMIHPVTTYLGYVGFAIPYAFAVAALVLQRADAAWIKVTRRWTLTAWLFLTIGIISGGQWAYVELGWGGYWTWDPVENASLLPWLTSTAFLHSVMIQEKKGMLKVWNVSLIAATFILTILGTFLSRSGVLDSVHAFGETTLGLYFLGFMAAATVASVYLIVSRPVVFQEENRFESYLSKESSFLLNNLLLVGSAFSVLWGTVFPLISEAVRGVKVTVGAPYFNQINLPIFLATIVVIGVCPLIAWKKSSAKNLRDNFLYPFTAAAVFAVAAYALGVRKAGALLGFTGSAFVMAMILLEVVRGVRVRMRMAGENPLTAFVRMTTRNRRRYGGYLVHLGVVLMAIGITGSLSYQRDVTTALTRGEAMSVAGYTATYENLAWRQEPHRVVVYADLKIEKDGRTLGVLRPEKAFHPGFENPVTEVGILGSLSKDLYGILGGDVDNLVKSLEDPSTPTVFKFIVNPLVAWIWIGGYVMTFGTLFAVWPQARRRASEAVPTAASAERAYEMAG